MADRPQQLDTSIEIVTPENIALVYRLAGPFRRLPAYLIDLAIRSATFLLTMLVLGFVLGFAGMGWLALGLGLVFWFLLAWFYGGLFETYFNGQTPGKRMMQIRVLSVDGQPVGGLQAVLRNVLRVIDGQPGLFFIFGPFMYLLGLGAVTMSRRFQRLGDLACGTMVVVEEKHWFRGVTQINEPEAAALAALIPANFQPSRTLARALSAYVERRRLFSAARRLEIARHLGEPLRQRFGLPADTSLDLLLCGLYQRTFITESDEAESDGSAFGKKPELTAAVVDPAGAMEHLARY